MKVLFAADLHGNRYAYKTLFARAANEKVGAIILGGDLTPKWPIISYMNKSVVPFAPQLPAMDPDTGKTFTCLLQAVADEHRSGPGTLLRHHEMLGGYVVHAGHYKKFAELLAEQTLLHRLMTAPRSPRLDSFTAAEWETLSRMLQTTTLKESAPDLLVSLREAALTPEQMLRLQQVTQSIDDQITTAIAQTSDPEVRQMLQAIAPKLVRTRYGKDFEKVQGHLITIAGQHSLHVLHEAARDSTRLIKEQTRFLQHYLKQMLARLRKQCPDCRVFAMLGNDDMVECEPVMKHLESRGLLTYISDAVVPLTTDLNITGYPYVRDSYGAFYAGWEKTEEDILSDLNGLSARVGSHPTVYVIHTPPANTCLDNSFRGAHFGSVGVRSWIEAATPAPHLVLSGHIHEAPFTSGGSWQDTINGVLCYQPGGWHDTELCAVLFETERPDQATWLCPQNHRNT